MMRLLMTTISFLIASFIFSRLAYAQEKILPVAQKVVKKLDETVAPALSSAQVPTEVIPEVGKHVGANMDAVSMIFSLLAVLVLIVVSGLLLKRFQPNHLANKDLKIVTSLSLGAKERLIVVQVGDKQQLLGITPQQITLLDTLERPLKANTLSRSEFGQSFVSIFQKYRSKEQKSKKP